MHKHSPTNKHRINRYFSEKGDFHLQMRTPSGLEKALEHDKD